MSTASRSLTKAEAAERIRLDGVVSAYHTRIAPACGPRGWRAGWPMSSNDWASTSTSSLRVTAIHGRSGEHADGHRHRADRVARDGGIHRRAARAGAALAADEQFDDRHRSDRPRRVGFDRGAGAARPSGTLRTAFSTPSAPSTTASPSAGAASPTATRHAPTPTVACRNGRSAPGGYSARRAAADPRRADRPRVVRWLAVPRTGRPASCTTEDRVWAGPADTSGTASPPRTWPGARWRTWCSTAAPR